MSRKQVAELIRWAERNGWSVELTSGDHLRYTHPAVKGPVFGASTPSDHRAVRNQKALMRRVMRRNNVRIDA